MQPHPNNLFSFLTLVALWVSRNTAFMQLQNLVQITHVILKYSEQVNHGVISNKRSKKGCRMLPKEAWFRANLSCWLWHPSINTLVLIMLYELSYLRQQWAGCPDRWQSGTGLAHSLWHSPEAKTGHSHQTTDPQGSAHNGFAGCTYWSRSHSSAKPVSRQVWHWRSDEE